jgi:hypothetical protein
MRTFRQLLNEYSFAKDNSEEPEKEPLIPFGMYHESHKGPIGPNGKRTGTSWLFSAITDDGWSSHVELDNFGKRMASQGYALSTGWMPFSKLRVVQDLYKQDPTAARAAIIPHIQHIYHQKDKKETLGLGEKHPYYDMMLHNHPAGAVWTD